MELTFKFDDGRMRRVKLTRQLAQEIVRLVDAGKLGCVGKEFDNLFVSKDLQEIQVDIDGVYLVCETSGYTRLYSRLLSPYQFGLIKSIANNSIRFWFGLSGDKWYDVPLTQVMCEKILAHHVAESYVGVALKDGWRDDASIQIIGGNVHMLLLPMFGLSLHLAPHDIAAIKCIMKNLMQENAS